MCCAATSVRFNASHAAPCATSHGENSDAEPVAPASKPTAIVPREGPILEEILQDGGLFRVEEDADPVSAVRIPAP